jgi:hypothetical protein
VAICFSGGSRNCHAAPAVCPLISGCQPTPPNSGVTASTWAEQLVGGGPGRLGGLALREDYGAAVTGTPIPPVGRGFAIPKFADGLPDAVRPY